MNSKKLAEHLICKYLENASDMERVMKRIRVTQAAKILGVSAASVRDWGKQGLIKPAFISPGGQRYYDEDEIRKIAKEGRLAGTKDDEPRAAAPRVAA